MLPPTRVRECTRRRRADRSRIALGVGAVLLAIVWGSGPSAIVAATCAIALVALFLPLRLRASAAIAAGIALVALDIPDLAERSSPWPRILLLHGGQIVAAAALLCLRERPSRGSAAVAIAALGLLTLYLILPSGAGFAVALERLAIADYELRVLTIFEWVLLPVAAAGLVAALGRTQDAVFPAALLILWYPANMALTLSFDLPSLEAARDHIDTLARLITTFVGRLWICVGAARWSRYP